MSLYHNAWNENPIKIDKEMCDEKQTLKEP